MFARNRLCALASPAVKATTANLLDRMLDPAMKLGTSTPKADPSGDYAWEVFARAEAMRPGARDALSKKALQLVGGPASAPPPKDRSAYGSLIENGSADLFLTYCTNATSGRTFSPARDSATTVSSWRTFSSAAIATAHIVRSGSRVVSRWNCIPGQVITFTNGLS